MKKGISLIVLIITIIIVVILAVTIIITISKNNPIENANEAKFKEDIRTFQTELEMYKSGMILRGEDTSTLTASSTTEPSIKQIITSMNDEYTKILKINAGRLIYIGNKNDIKYQYADSLGIIDPRYLVDDDIYPELKSCITEWTVNAGDTIYLPTRGTSDFTVDFGDGSAISHNTTTHTYEKEGTYTVTITGKCTSFTFLVADAKNTKDKITKLVQWGDLGCTVYSFANCTNLKGTIPEPTKNTFKNVTEASTLFFCCTGITGSIPANLFAGADIKKFAESWGAGTFRNCSGLTGTIPEDLFKDCKNATTFSSVFSGCTGLTGPIPNNLFANCTKVTTFAGAFNNCSGITGSIPGNMFQNCTSVLDYSNVFFGCSSLVGTVPGSLFASSNEAVNFLNSFSGCKGITEVENIFSGKDKAQSFNSVFLNCTELKKVSPEIFKGCKSATDFTACFSSCVKLEEIPQEIFKDCISATTFKKAFYECKSITKIPQDLFRYNTEVITFSSTYAGLFQYCIGIESVPEDLFRYNTKAKDFSGMFYGCSKLREISKDIFKYNTEITSLAYAFAVCNELRVIPYLTNNTKVTDMTNTFFHCINLEGTAPELWNNSNITTHKGTFYYCIKLSNYADIPETWKNM